ncbi:hypothetical protein INR49_010195 [Caranx melampygus]|nr:hypothetical protein INR49_010195 [Caranx melampygus]
MPLLYPELDEVFTPSTEALRSQTVRVVLLVVFGVGDSFTTTTAVSGVLRVKQQEQLNRTNKTSLLPVSDAAVESSVFSD